MVVEHLLLDHADEVAVLILADAQEIKILDREMILYCT